MTVFCTAKEQFYPVSTVVYAEDIVAGDYFELWVTTNGSNNDTITVQDAHILFESK